MDYSDKQEPIAIIGAACRFAGEASSLGSLWDMISKVKTGHCEVPSDRWDSKNWYHPDPDRKGGISSQHGYFIQQDISHFDAPFFSTTAKEAAAMDPMKRMLLEVSYESIENSGILVEDLMNSQTGCYVGCMTNDYEMTSLHDIYDIGHPAAVGLSEAMTANRVSWFFGLKGPSLTLDTACSSSLYALHLACQSLRLKETNMSLVAGVNLMFNPNTMHQLTAMHMLSPEGISHTFDDRANGYGRGDGIGAMVVKRLSDAIRDGDTIRAVIRGSGANADGKTPSITQPSSTAQADLINQTYDAAGLDLAETDYFECHGTGTPVGDPLELTAIATTLGAARRSAGKTPLYVGSIKPTVGHTEGCAGLAGVFKSILLLEKGMLVPTYGVERVNPKLKLNEWHLALPTDMMRWPTSGMRRISVNSFGFGGSNAHVILDDAYHYLQERGISARHNTTVINDSGSDSGVEDASVNGSSVPTSSSKKLFLLSGKDQTGAKRVSDVLGNWLQRDSDDDQELLTNLSYTLALKRTHLEHRTFAIADSLPELTDKLSKGMPAATRSQRHGDNLVMIFTGQGAQWATMGQALFENPIFRQSIDVSQAHLTSLGCEWNAMEELSKSPNPNVDRPEYSQPLCTVVQVALIDLLRFWKMLPTATIGHSSGEIAAAYAASLLTHYDAIKLAYVRGISSAAVSKQGAMMAAGLSEDEAQKYLESVAPGSAVVACINSPSSVTISGDVDAINQLETLISADGKFARKLKVTTAYHSPHMLEVSQTYLGMIGEISPKEADTTNASNSPVMYSSLTGSVVKSSAELDAQYWVNNMQNPVKFSHALLALLKHKKVAPGGTRPTAVQWGGFLEVGPHAALQGPLRQIIDTSNNKFAKSAPYVSMLVRGKDATETSMNAAGVLWAAGAKVDMSAVNQYSPTSSPHMLCDLPAYPWNHSRGFWHESYASRSYRFPTHVRCDFLGIPEDAQNSHEPRWRNYLRVTENPWIEDHIITGTVLYPGAGMLVMAVEGVLRTADASKTVEGFRLTDVMFERGLVISLDDASPVETRISFHPHGTKSDSWVFTVYSMTKGSPWAKHCSGTVAVVYEQKQSEVENSKTDALWENQQRLHKSLSSEDSFDINVDEFYNNLDSIGMQYGPSFRNVLSLTAVPSKDASYGSVAVPDTASTMPKNHESPHVIHPATMDSIFHLALATLNGGRPVKQSAVPYSIEEIYVAKDQPKGSGALYSGYGRLLSQVGHEITTELVVSDQTWEKPKLVVKTFALRQVTAGDGGDANGDSLSGPVKNCAGITWTPDVDFLTSNEALTKLAPSGNAAELVDTWLNSVFLKTSRANVLVALFDASKSSIDVLNNLTNRRYGPKSITAFATTEDGLQLLKKSFGENSEETISYTMLPEEEILQLSAPEATDVAIALGVSDLSRNAASLASLAPLACITQAGDFNQAEFVMPGSNCVGRLVEDTYVLLTSDISSSVPELPESVALLLPASPSDAIITLACNIQSKLESDGISVTQARLTLEDVASLSGKAVISLLEIDSPLVYSWAEDQFQAFKALVSTVAHLFWITHGSVLESWSNGVEFAATQGLFRVMRNEYPVAILPSLDLSAVADITTVRYSDLVVDIWQTSLAEDAEMEYAEGHELVYIPRTVDDAGFDHELQLANKTAKPISYPLSALVQPLRATESVSGQEYIWIPDENADSPLESDQLEVKVEYAGLNNNSVRHAVGSIVSRGESVSVFELGQKVIVFAQDAAKTHIRQYENLVASLPQDLEPKEAVVLVDPLMTAHYALVEMARLTQEQSVLIDNAASAVGKALITVAKAIGVKIFALVHDVSERDVIVNSFGVSANHVFDSALNNFVPLIETATDKLGVDVVVSQETGKHIAGALSVLSPFGQYVDINPGSTGVVIPSSKANAILTRINMKAVIEARPTLVAKLFQQIFTKYTLNGISSTTAVSVTDFKTSSLNSQGAIVFDDASLVLMPPPASEELELDSEATYVLAGGLGALGLDIANWMVDCGAKNLVFLSRSGGSKNQEDLDKFTERSVRAEAFKCNVNDANSVATVFDTLKASGRKIAGVIQLAMVLEDGIFDNMSYEQWCRAIEPKTKGSRNLLATIWPGDKPFFILLSSITGVIGNTAQANYASGNTFEDALAHHSRTHLGINATTIDVGLVSDSSHFTASGEFGALDSYLGRYQHGWRGLQTNLEELAVVMKAIMRGSNTNGDDIPAQVILGLNDKIEQNDSTSGFSRDRKFELRVVKTGAQAGDGSAKQDIGTLLANATTMAEAASAVEENIKELVAAAMGIALEEVDGQKPLYDYGVDSLQAVEIRNRSQKNMKSDISVFDILSAMPLADVAAKIAGKSQLVKVAAEE